jgi:hypothetical protein
LNPTTVANCKNSENDCTSEICGNSDYKEYPTCKTFNKAIEDCKDDSEAYKDIGHCKTYCTKYPSKIGCINPTTANACREKIDDCSAKVCNEVTTYSKYPTC